VMWWVVEWAHCAMEGALGVPWCKCRRAATRSMVEKVNSPCT
jgi:hypothetical protein